MGLNQELIRGRFADIEESLARLEQLKMLPRQSFLADQDALDVASYRLLVAIEAAIQVCFHVRHHALAAPQTMKMRLFSG